MARVLRVPTFRGGLGLGFWRTPGLINLRTGEEMPRPPDGREEIGR
jgi:hypothetical protein